MIESHPLPQSVEEEIKWAYKELVNYLIKSGDEGFKLAVRSSATTEDLPGASFAGQFDTFLGIRGQDELLEAVKKCWSSLFTARAIAYRNARGIPAEGSSMSVGVQKMIEAKAAGVLFTLDPVTGNRAKIIINANWGLGESIAKGITNVDFFVVNKVTLEIIRKDISVKKLQSVVDYEKGEVIETEVPPQARALPCLRDEEVKELARQAKLIEQHYRRAQDIEFAIDKRLEFPQNIFIIQSRPETKWSAQIKPIMKPKGHIAEHLVSWFRGKLE